LSADVKIVELRVPPKDNDENFPKYIEADEVEEQPKNQPKNGFGNSHNDSEIEENQKHKIGKWQKDHPTDKIIGDLDTRV